MEDSHIQAQILAQVQKIKDEQKQREEREEEARKQKLEREEEARKQAYIQQQAEIIINSEKYESLSEAEKLNLLTCYYNNCIKIKHSKRFENFFRYYPFMHNIMDKYDIHLKSREYQDYKEEIEEQARLKAIQIENERKAKEAEEAQYKQYLERIEQLNKSLQLFSSGKGAYPSYSYPFQISHEYSYLNHFMSTKDPEFVEKFWNYIDRNGGFSKCPTCGNTPKVMRFGKCPIRQVGNMVTCSGDSVRCVENLFFKDSYDSPPIENIYCCEHLYDFSNKKRYILSSKCLIEKPKKEFHVNTHQFYGNVYKPTEYVEYNPLDPYGEEAKKIQDRLASLKELEELEERMKVLKQSLNL
jgi:hypothetical protein